MTQKRIVIINQYAGSPHHGMEYRHYYLAKELTAKGHQVIIISGSFSHLYKTNPAIGPDNYTFEKVDGIEYCWVKVPIYERSVSIGRIWNMLVFMFRLFSFPLEKIHFADAVIVSSPSLFPIINGKKWARKFQCKLFFEVRDIWPLTLQELGKLSSLHPIVVFLSWFEKYAYRNADVVVGLLPFTNEHIKDLGIVPKSYSYIPNGIYLPEAQNNLALDKRVLEKIDMSIFKVGYVGTLGLSNAMDYFISACRLLKDDNRFHFYIVGEGGQKQQLIEMAEGLSNITFLDAIPKNQVQSFLYQMDACYIGWKDDPLYRFGISANKIYDYMYSARPVVHSVKAGNDPVKVAECGLSIPPEDPESIREAFFALHSMTKQQLEEMGQRGKAYVLQNFNYSILVSKYLNLLKG
jgi:glycosyltransferase involved in cell wall biosynthesis